MTSTANSPAISPPSLPIRLDLNLIWGVPYTHHDDVVSTLLEVITCPIMCSSAENMIVFNDQCVAKTP